jgi:ribonuclease HI
MIEIYFDGACEPINPGGTASYGYLVKRDGKTIIQGSKIIGTGKGMTNNVAEYTGLIEAIKAISNLNTKEKVRICGDSKIVCNTIAKKWGWNKKKTVWNPHKNAPHLKPLLEEALNLLKSFDYEIKWVSSKDNQQADRLSREPLIKAGIIRTESQRINCPKCEGYLIERKGPFSRFYGCSNYPKCRFTKKIDDK